MARKKRTEAKLRLFCLEDELILLDGDFIVKSLEIEPLILKGEIEKQILLGEKQPALIFKKAVENITGLKLILKYKELTIHDSEYYRGFLGYMLSSLNIEKQHKRNKEVKEARALYQKENYPYYQYKRENQLLMKKRFKLK